MITNKQILQRFAELDQEAQAILATNHGDPEYPKILFVDGNRVFTWVKNILSLLRSIFSKDSEQYQQFSTIYHGDRDYNTFKDYYAVFTSIYTGFEKSLIRTTTVGGVLEQTKTLLGTG